MGGKPLIVWTIEQALAVPGVRVAVSTEDVEIAAVSEISETEAVRQIEQNLAKSPRRGAYRKTVSGCVP